MAGALRPVVLLMLFASVLFVVDGFLDGVYPGGPAWFTGKYDNLAEIAYLFAILNTVVAIMVARGSERSLQSRIGLSVFFLVERPVTAFALGPKPIESVITHFRYRGRRAADPRDGASRLASGERRTGRRHALLARRPEPDQRKT